MSEEILIDEKSAENITSRDASELAAECYTDLSEYVIKTRAYASVVDGMKAVYRRTVYASRVYKQKIKSVAIVGDSIKLHPHGDSSIIDVLNRMACPYGAFPLYDKKGNFGGMGSGAAAPRYTEACLSELGRLMYLELIDYAEMIDGEAGFPEPKYLPALIPYCLLVGSGGIPVGMPTPNIPSLNALELVDYWIARLENREARIPTIDVGSVIIDCSRSENMEPMITNGQGKIWYKGLVVQEDDNKFVISDGTPNCYIDKVVQKMQWWIDEEIVDFMDESDKNGYRYVFTINDTSKISPNELKSKLEKILSCSVTYRFILEEDEKAVYCGIDYIYKKNIKYLRECTVRKFTDECDKVNSKLDILRAIRDFKTAGYVSKLNDMTDDQVIEIINNLGYEDWVGKAVLDKPIRYLNKSHDDDIENLQEEYEKNLYYLNNPDKYLLTLYYKLRDKIQEISESKNHSIVASEMTDRTNYRARLDSDSNIEISDSIEGIKWNRNLLMIYEDSRVVKRFVSARSDTIIHVDESDKCEFLASDIGKYLVLVVDRNIVVKRISDIQNNKVNTKLWEGSKIDDVFVTSNEDIKVIDERSNEQIVHLEDYIRSRISYPIKCTKYSIRRIMEID